VLKSKSNRRGVDLVKSDTHVLNQKINFLPFSTLGSLIRGSGPRFNRSNKILYRAAIKKGLRLLRARHSLNLEPG
jgi:hypothetical protein